MNKCDEQKQEELSKMSETQKKTEGKAFKNGEKQEVFILQNNIQLILTSYNICLVEQEILVFVTVTQENDKYKK